MSPKNTPRSSERKAGPGESSPALGSDSAKALGLALRGVRGWSWGPAAVSPGVVGCFPLSGRGGVLCWLLLFVLVVLRFVLVWSLRVLGGVLPVGLFSRWWVLLPRLFRLGRFSLLLLFLCFPVFRLPWVRLFWGLVSWFRFLPSSSPRCWVSFVLPVGSPLSGEALVFFAP